MDPEPTYPPPSSKRARHSSQYDKQVENGNAQQTVSSLPPLSLSILGVEPLDEFIKEIADFVHHMISTRPQDVSGKVEVEAKIGVLKDRGGQRLFLPVLVETILRPDTVDCRFESNMTAHQHKHYNGLLNKLKITSSQPGYASGTPLEYNHLYLVDSFYPSETGSDKSKIRVTRDEKTGNVVEVMKKIRLGDLNVVSPRWATDWRVSVNLEVPVSHPLGSATHTRRKDRMSYTHEEFVIDLTQVTSTSGGTQEVLHELEVEIARPELLMATAAKRNDPSVPEHERHAFDELIRAFVNNARILVRNSDPAGAS
ncbi:mRNA triphosphatase CET1 [Dendrothele bispora CBS 962.96]|uniref:mRNA-capping enzyme subunit beta n=1 Tax=Dendrothele bispora (strain CBS 962.96) TaxID=1314807 RepID=A0A4S8MLI0_DENBC|nr:mRNA triphosphatase CET1 [Dendrothele bispora CBS 962.96]